MTSIAVLGGGVSGLSTAIQLAEVSRNEKVTIYADHRTPETTSDVAPALFFPYIVPPTRLVLDAARRTRDLYLTLISSGVGLRVQTHYEVCTSGDYAKEQILPFRELFDDFARLDDTSVPGNYPFGWRLETLFIDTREFMPYLEQRFLSAGGQFAHGRIDSIDEIAQLQEEVVVNCLGLNGGRLFGDTSVVPVKGQLVYTTPKGALEYSILHDSFYVFPRNGTWVLGGTTERGVADLAASGLVTERIVEGNRRILPSLKVGDVVGVKTGLRPLREGGPRVELESMGTKIIAHNYGHGGSGWTLSWGCAEILVAELHRPTRRSS